MKVDVLVVGAGPVGLTAALLLDRLGLSVAVVERRPGPQRAPAAHVVSPRTFEIWRQIGLDVDALRALAQDPATAGAVHWVTRLGGEVLGSLPFERQGDDALGVTPTPLRNLSQHRIEPFLVAALAQAGVEVGYDREWESADRRTDGVTSTVVGPDGPETVASRWLLACDGASSAVRRAVGIVPEGPHRLQSFVMVHIAADFRELVGRHPGALFWVCDPECGGAFVCHGIDREWVYMHPVDAAEPGACPTPEVAAALVRAALVDAALPFEVVSVSTWTMTAQVAPRFRDGPVFLVGDAAHRFPPTGGLGLNTGVQDAHNLAWKLAAVAHDDADDRLLDTYEPERRPVAQRNADVSLRNALKLAEVPVALGTDADVVATARANLDATLRSDDGRARVAVAIEHQRTHFDMLGLQLGYSYGDAPDPCDADDIAVREYVARVDPGARLPHGWIRVDGRTRSTLDLVPLDRSVVIVGPASPVTDADRRIGADLHDPDGWWSDTLGLPATGALLVRPDQHIERCERQPARGALRVR